MRTLLPQMTLAAQTTNSVAHLPKASSSAAAAEGAFISLVGTAARKTFASTIRPLSDRILAANSISAIGSGDTEIWNFRMSIASCLSAVAPSVGLETARDKPAFSNDLCRSTQPSRMSDRRLE